MRTYMCACIIIIILMISLCVCVQIWLCIGVCDDHIIYIMPCVHVCVKDPM